MPEPELRGKTLMECADSLEKISMIFHDIGVTIADAFPGLSAVVGDYTTTLKNEALFLREY
jgi:hypothetical protein